LILWRHNEDRDAFLCDDVRKEGNGKLILLAAILATLCSGKCRHQKNPWDSIEAGTLWRSATTDEIEIEIKLGEKRLLKVSFQ